MDPYAGLRIRILGSVHWTNGSGSCSFHQLHSRCQQKIITIPFLLVDSFTSVSEDNKLPIEVTKQFKDPYGGYRAYKVLPYGSESEMRKNLRVLRIAPEHLHEQVRFFINFRTRTLPFFSRTYLDFFLPALPHAVAHIGLESEAQRHHRIPNAENKTKILLFHITPTVWPSIRIEHDLQ